MQVQSTYRFARISAFKAREVTREIQGLPATDALSLLRFTPKKAAALISKTLKSAIANAENNHQLDVDQLVVSRVEVGRSVVMKRFHARARGRAGRIEKWLSHMTIVVAERAPEAPAPARQEAA